MTSPFRLIPNHLDSAQCLLLCSLSIFARLCEMQWSASKAERNGKESGKEQECALAVIFVGQCQHPSEEVKDGCSDHDSVNQPIHY